VSKAVELFVGARILTTFGPVVVVELGRHGPTVKDALGDDHFIRADQLAVTSFGDRRRRLRETLGRDQLEPAPFGVR